METIIWPLDATVAQPDITKWEFLWQYNISQLKIIAGIIDGGIIKSPGPKRFLSQNFYLLASQINPLNSMISTSQGFMRLKCDK